MTMAGLVRTLLRKQLRLASLSCRVLRYQLGRWPLLWALVTDGIPHTRKSDVHLRQKQNERVQRSFSVSINSQTPTTWHAIPQCGCGTSCCIEVHVIIGAGTWSTAYSMDTNDRQYFRRPSNPLLPSFPAPVIRATCLQLGLHLALGGRGGKNLYCVRGPSFPSQVDHRRVDLMKSTSHIKQQRDTTASRSCN